MPRERRGQSRRRSWQEEPAGSRGRAGLKEARGRARQRTSRKKATRQAGPERGRGGIRQGSGPESGLVVVQKVRSAKFKVKSLYWGSGCRTILVPNDSSLNRAVGMERRARVKRREKQHGQATLPRTPLPKGCVLSWGTAQTGLGKGTKPSRVVKERKAEAGDSNRE